jgi:predicted SnoaL-like aldol condensation-catalyzing enzyme
VTASPNAINSAEIVERYNYELWNEQKYAIAMDIIGDQIVRNTPGARVTLSRGQAVQRIRDLWASVRSVRFTLLHTIADKDLCTIVYQAEIINHDGTDDFIASIEVFRVSQGRIVEVWNNCTYDHERWPEFAEGVRS